MTGPLYSPIGPGTTAFLAPTLGHCCGTASAHQQVLDRGPAPAQAVDSSAGDLYNPAAFSPSS
jgi:hypothetical protein